MELLSGSSSRNGAGKQFAAGSESVSGRLVKSFEEDEDEDEDAQDVAQELRRVVIKYTVHCTCTVSESLTKLWPF